jgi:hypothetical protein
MRGIESHLGAEWDFQARRSEPGMIFDLKINSSEPRTSGVR